jgi:hypothetical protein
MHPSDHRSAVWSYGCSRTSSGAMYSGVPCIRTHAQHKHMQQQQLCRVERGGKRSEEIHVVSTLDMRADNV